MLQASKVLRSRNTLRHKIIKCHYEIREFRKTRKRHLNTIAELKLENRKMRRIIKGNKQQLLELTKEVESKNTITQLVETQKSAEKVVTLEDADQTRALCVLLVIHAVVSYRSVPRILELFKLKTEFAVPWVPHFTSVINWSLRLGLGLLKQVKPITNTFANFDLS